MAKTPKTTTTPETSATTVDAMPVDATADTSPAPAAVTGGDFVPGVDGGPPTATPIVPAAPPAAANDTPQVTPEVSTGGEDPAVPEVIADAPPAVASGPLPPCAACGDGVHKDVGFATDGRFMAVTDKAEIETVHASNHVVRKIRNFHFRCAARLIERAVDGGAAL